MKRAGEILSHLCLHILSVGDGSTFLLRLPHFRLTRTLAIIDILSTALSLSLSILPCTTLSLATTPLSNTLSPTQA